ncbi:AAA family ATPase [Streptomyces virginiae]|uniref:helix-turn-helix transcriptional regulator n=1 Tax=Streptomyces virginiae TaxID=1961 RepID=UPI0036628286
MYGEEAGSTEVNLYGRDRERQELDRLLEEARRGNGSALVLWGDPGIGKTALLEYAAAQTTGFTVLGCRGSRMESRLAFAALHGLLWPLVDRIGTLPKPQADALRGALGHTQHTTDRFLIGVATLTLLTELAAEEPLLITVDDTDQLDEPTAACLAFVARRLDRSRVAMLLATHTDPAAEGPWEGRRAIGLAPICDADAERLIRAERPTAPEETVRRTVAAACGNPLALRELPALTAGPEERLPVGPRLRRAFGSRTSLLSPGARSLMLVAAAEDRGDQHLVRAAAATLGAGAAAWDEVLRSGLLTLQGATLRFKAPLVGAVVYDAAPFAERQAAHRALAQALERDAVEEGLRAWHLAAATDVADEAVADLLERTARHDAASGGNASAVRALLRASELSPDPVDAARRLSLGALAAWECGQVTRARDLLDQAGRLSPAQKVAEDSGGLSGLIEFAHGDQEDAHRLLLRDATSVSDRTRAMELACLAVRAGWAAGSPARQASALRRLSELTCETDTPEASVLSALAPWWSDAEAVPPFAEDVTAPLGTVSWRLMPPAPLAAAWGAERAVSDVLGRKLEVMRCTDATNALVLTVPQTATLDIVTGRWSQARANATETLRLAEEIGADHAASQCRNSLGWLAALSGDEEAVTELSAVTLQLSVPRRVRALTAAAYWNQGQAALFAGRAEEALEFLVRLTEPGHDAAHGTFALLAAADTVEAAVRAGRSAVGEAATEALSSWYRRTGVPWAVAAAHRSTALLSGDRAEEWFERALRVPGAADRPFWHSRTRLLYGEWLRRAKRRTEARLHLAEAAETFARLGAQPMLVRARSEMELTGFQPRPVGVAEESVLTPQELRVAKLAAEGLTNKEIACHLLISPRTVGHHLSNVFPKLGVVARSELARVDFDNGLRMIA